MSNQRSAIVIGAGIAGLALTRALCVRGYKVTVFERNQRAVGASIRNFGMIWPIGQLEGALLDAAMLSRSIWKSICEESGIWHSETGSLHLAYQDDELAVMEEFAALSQGDRDCVLLNKEETLRRSPAVNPGHLRGALWSGGEMIVEARTAIGQIAAYLASRYQVVFHWNTAVNRIEYPSVGSGKRTWQADRIYVCSGTDFETLYPEIYREKALTKCKLQMMRIMAQQENWQIGPSLCGGLSLIHYKSFAVSPSLETLRGRYERDYAEYLKWGIHVMVSQNGASELTIGDSHEYGLSHDPFNRETVNQLILDYLKTFAVFRDWRVLQTWNGTYAKATDGEPYLVAYPEEGVTIMNALGGAGMTLSFGLAEKLAADQL